MGKARSKAAPQLTVVPEPEPEPTETTGAAPAGGICRELGRCAYDVATGASDQGCEFWRDCFSEPEPTPAVAAPDGPREVVEARVGKALQDAFANPLDWSAPCSQTVPRPRQLEGRKVQGHVAGDLFCNRPGNHQGPHRVYSGDFHVLAEVPR